MMNCKKEQKEKINDNNRKVTNNGLPVEDETPPMPGLTQIELFIFCNNNLKFCK